MSAGSDVPDAGSARKGAAEAPDAEAVLQELQDTRAAERASLEPSSRHPRLRHSGVMEHARAADGWNSRCDWRCVDVVGLRARY
eukprot:1337128-Lingulodinium_polyedra.AAC.1